MKNKTPHRGTYSWQVVFFDKYDRMKSSLTIKADSFDQAVVWAKSQITWGERVCIDGITYLK